MIKDEIKELLREGLRELDLSDYPFGKVREVLDELGYALGDTPIESDVFDDYVNGWELDYSLYIFKQNEETGDVEYTGYVIAGSFWYGTCEILKYDVSDESY